MKKTYFKNLFRDIKKSISRFLSIVVIIAVGVAFYVGVRATSPDMKMSADNYFEKINFMDFKIVSTLGLTEDDLAEIRSVKGVSRAEGSYSLDAVTEKGDSQMVLNINSIPEKDGINDIVITSGRRAESPDEAVVEEKFAKENSLKLNDILSIKSGGDKDLGESLKNTEFKIVGTAKSPLYISAQRQLSSVGNGTVRGFVYIVPEVFKSEVYTQVYAKAESAKSDVSLLESEEYSSYIGGIEKELEILGESRSETRYNEIVDEADAQIKEAEERLDQARAYAEIGSEEAAAEVKRGEEEIAKSREAIDEIKKPEWYLLGRAQNLGYETYRQDSDRIDNIGKVFPLIFFLVAALVSLTTMTRMVQENRTEIGTFKALGYSTESIVAHYFIYSLLASLTGSILGVAIGFRLFPPLIMNAYGSLYQIPEMLTPFNMGFALQASLIAVLSTCIAVIAATLDELKEVPASLMRPKPPKSGKKILLERVSFIWKRLKFTRKVTARNIFRYKQRLFMTVIGIAACTGLMITGFGLKDGIIGATEVQFNEIYKYDMTGSLKKDIDREEKDKMKLKELEDKNIESIMYADIRNGEVETPKSRSEDVFVVVPEDKQALSDYIKLYLEDEGLKLDDKGVVITEKLSRLIDKTAGDSIEIVMEDKAIEVKISAITEQYVQHYIYMSPDYYAEVSGEDPRYNSFYGLLKDSSDKAEENTLNKLKSIGDVNSVSFKSNAKVDYDQSMDSIDSVVMILIASAGVLAFVVIYNLTNINISERRRELATIKLLGFYNKELAAYIYRENMILTVLGSLAGILVGMFLNRFVLSTAETNIIKFLGEISPVHILYSVLLTILFSAVVNIAMYRRFDSIDMIESLKSAE